ncbi:hypothetical protein D3C84_654920 [compost metagenome]
MPSEARNLWQRGFGGKWTNMASGFCGEGACPHWAAKQPQNLPLRYDWKCRGALRAPTGASPLATEAHSPQKSTHHKSPYQCQAGGLRALGANKGRF